MSFSNSNFEHSSFHLNYLIHHEITQVEGMLSIETFLIKVCSKTDRNQIMKR